MRRNIKVQLYGTKCENFNNFKGGNLGKIVNRSDLVCYAITSLDYCRLLLLHAFSLSSIVVVDMRDTHIMYGDILELTPKQSHI